MPLSSLRLPRRIFTHHMGQFSTSVRKKTSVSLMFSNFPFSGAKHPILFSYSRLGGYERDVVPSSRMVLSPNTTTSNSRFAIRRFRMFLLGLLLALMSRAHMPITPSGAGLAAI
jgi:hypothetical protein